MNNVTDLSKKENKNQCFNKYKNLILRVFPVHGITKEGFCACGNKQCSNPGKHPCISEWQKVATTNFEQIQKWEVQFPNCNWGTPTGKDDGHIVVDVDEKNGGFESVKKLEEKFGKFPTTITDITGSKGYHFFYKYPPGIQIKNSVSKIADGIDIRADGGFVVIPHSLHKSGNNYAWSIDGHPDEVRLAELPEWLVELSTAHAKNKEHHQGSSEKIYEGSRNSKLASLAGSMRRKSFSYDSILAALHIENKNKCIPPLSEEEVASIAQSVSKYSPHSEEWLTPKPLTRVLPPPEAFPVDALGFILSETTRDMHRIIRAPEAICAQSLLAATNLAVQSHADIEIDGRIHPISCNFITIAESGERKSAGDRAATKAHKEHQKKLKEEYDQDLIQFKIKQEAYKQTKAEVFSSKSANKGFENKKVALENIGQEPEPPLLPLILSEEPTFEGLTKQLCWGYPFHGIFSDEGGRLLGGYSMNDDNLLKTITGFSKLWDGDPITRVRSSEESYILYGRRVSFHIMIQPFIAQELLSNRLISGQGFLSRCLISWPESIVGTRKYKSEDIQRSHALLKYWAKIDNILQQSLPLKENSRNELNPRLIKLESEAKNLWIEFHDSVESELCPNGKLLPIRGFANKAPEHVLRLAGTQALFENLNAEKIKLQHIENGIILVTYYLNEALRLFDSNEMDESLLLAQKLLEWLQKRTEKTISLQDIYQLGPNSIRNAKTAKRLMDILYEHGWVKPIKDSKKSEWEVRS